MSAIKVSANNLNLRYSKERLALMGSPYKISVPYSKKQPRYDGIYKKLHVSANKVSANILRVI